MVAGMVAILQKTLPQDDWLEAIGRSLPGVRPLEGPWLRVDDAVGAQLALRDRLIAERPNDVLAALGDAKAAVAELRAMVAREAAALTGFRLESGTLVRPDGVRLGPEEPDMGFIGRACQEDFCLLQKDGEQHVLTAAALCFPASWKLSEKLGRPLTGIHVPVSGYDDNIASRVQRLFDGLQVERPIYRANGLFYDDPTLHQPQKLMERGAPTFFRSEFQVLRRLPETRAIVFSIHTIVLDINGLTARDRSRLPVGPVISQERR